MRQITELELMELVRDEKAPTYIIRGGNVFKRVFVTYEPCVPAEGEQTDENTMEIVG